MVVVETYPYQKDRKKNSQLKFRHGKWKKVRMTLIQQEFSIHENLSRMPLVHDKKITVTLKFLFHRVRARPEHEITKLNLQDNLQRNVSFCNSYFKVIADAYIILQNYATFIPEDFMFFKT